MMAAGATVGARWSDWRPRVGLAVADAALFLRRPARALCGSLRAAIVCVAAGFTVLLLSEATFLVSKSYYPHQDYEILIGVHIVVAMANIGLIFGVLTRKLNYLYGWMSIALADLFLAVAALIWIPLDLSYEAPMVFLLPLWHLLMQLVLLCLVHGMAHELRSGCFFDGGNDGGDRRGGDGDGWLQLNLAHETPPPPGAATAKPRSPAVLEPSACTTAPSPAPPAPLSSQC